MEFLAIFSLDDVNTWITAGGYFVLFGLLFACGLGLPLPEDIPLLIGGALIAQGQMDWWPVAIFAWCGIIGGDCVLYHMGKKYGLNITRVPFVGKHVTRARIERAEGLFAKYGVWVVAIGRLFAGIRGAMVIAAGTIRFNFVKFVIADGLAALVSGGLFVVLGYWFGSRLDWLKDQIAQWQHRILFVLIPVVVLIGLYIWWRRRKHRSLADTALEKVAEKTSAEPPAP
jgi:membrane protein DedA with SNARE-associated domain